jgi:hypothetical protein
LDDRHSAHVHDIERLFDDVAAAFFAVGSTSYTVMYNDQCGGVPFMASSTL